MTWNLRHEWIDGLRIGGAQLATCRHCGTLRTVDRSWDGRLSLASKTHYTRPGITNDAERIREDEPPCIAPETPAAIVAARNAQKRQEERAAALAAAIEAAPEEEPEAPPAKDAFPWPSNLLKW